MIVSDFIEWRKTQDQGATLEVLRVDEWRAEAAKVVSFDPVKHAEYLDLRGNKYAVGKPYENERTLLLGQR